jgi:hypothetical protein
MDAPGLIPGMARFFLHQTVKTDYGNHPAFYPMGTTGNFPEGKAAAA